MLNSELYETIVCWMNQIPFLKHHKIFSDYSDGTLFIGMLNHINTDFFGSTFHVLENQQQSNNWALNMSRLKLIVDKLNDYTHKHIDINVMSIAKDKDEEQILKFFCCICQLILESDFQDDFFVPVLKLSEEQQSQISTFLQHLFEPITQQEDRNLLDKIDELENENHKLQEQYQILKNEIIEQKQYIMKQEQEIKDKCEQINLLEQYQRKSSFNEEKIKEVEDLNKQLWLLQQKTKDLESKVQQSQGQVREINLVNQTIKLENEQLKLKIMQYVKQEQKLEQNKEKLQQQKQYYTNLIEEKDKQINKLQINYSDNLNQQLTEKKRTLQLEADIQQLQQKIIQLTSEFNEKETCLVEKIKEASRRESRRNSFDFAASSPKSRMNTNDQLNLAQDLCQQPTDQFYALQINMQIQEENYQKEIKILQEKLKAQEQSIKAWKQLNERSEDKIKSLESRITVVSDSYSVTQIAQQNEQIKYLTNMLNTFNEKFIKIKEEHLRLLKTCQ